MALRGQESQAASLATEKILLRRSGSHDWRHGWAQVPSDVKLMRSLTLRQVAHQPELSFSVKNRPAMSYRRGQAGIAVVAAPKEIEGLAGDPMVDADLRRSFS